MDNSLLKNLITGIEGSYSSSPLLPGTEIFDVFKYEWLAGAAPRAEWSYKVVLQQQARQYLAYPMEKMIGKTVNMRIHCR